MHIPKKTGISAENQKDEDDWEWLKEEIKNALVPKVVPEAQRYLQATVTSFLNTINKAEFEMNNPVVDYLFGGKESMKVDTKLINIELRDGLTFYFAGAIDGEKEVETSEYNQFSPKNGDLQFAINRRFISRAIKFAQSRKYLSIRLDKSNYWSRNVNFNIGDFFVEYPELRNKYYGDQKTAFLCNSNNANGYLNVTLRSDLSFLDVEIETTCDIMVTTENGREEKAFSFTFRPVFMVKPVIKDSKLYFKLAGMYTSKVSTVNGVSSAYKSDELLGLMLSGAADSLRERDLWGSHFPVENMITAGYKVLDKAIVIYGRVPKK
jgi:hypothetical protein